MVAPAPRDVNVGELLASAEALDEPTPSLEDLIGALLASRPSWMRDALCAESHPGVTFFPERGEDVEPAKQVCSRCLVLSECRSWAMEQGAELLGIWAGTSPAQRQQMRKADPRPPRLARHRVERSTGAPRASGRPPVKRMAAISAFLASHPDQDHAARAVAAAVGGDSRAIDRALAQLVEDGYATVHVGGIGADGRHHPRARYYRHLRPYAEAEDRTGCRVHPVEGSNTAA